MTDPATQLKDQFDRDGFLVVPGVLTAAQISQLRGSLGTIFAHPSQFPGDFDDRGRIGSVRLDVCARYPDLQWLLWHPPLLGTLRHLLGDDFVYLPEMSAHRRGFGDWHKDTTSQERAGLDFHWSQDYLMVEAALYLQSNTEEYGGGLDVIPGSHRNPDKYLSVIDRTVLDKARTKLKSWGVLPTKKGTPIASKAGDLVIFHFRLDHKASSARITPPTEASEKLAIFLACSRNNQHARTYTEYIRSRPDYQYLRGHQYPAPLLERAGHEGVRLLPG